MHLFRLGIVLSNTSVSFQHATWHVPPDMISVAERGAAAAPHTVGTPPVEPSTKPPVSSRATSSTSSTAANSHLSVNTANTTISKNGEIKLDVALKMIPKKKVKGNESSVWGEMEVLKGLDHPNIVSILSFLSSCINLVHYSPQLADVHAHTNCAQFP